MENIIDTIVSDPTFIWVVLILAIFLVLGLVKKIFKLVMAVIAAFVLYVGYLYYTGDDSPNAVNEAIENIKDIDTKKDTDTYNLDTNTSLIYRNKYIELIHMITIDTVFRYSNHRNTYISDSNVKE